VERLVLIDAAALPQSFPIYVVLGRTPVFGDLGYALTSKAMAVRMLLSLMSWDPRTVRDTDVEEYAHEQRFTGTPQALHRMCVQLDAESTLEIPGRLRQIDKPTLIVWGAEDTVTPLHSGRRLHEEIAGSRFEIIAHAGHIPHIERSDLVNPLILDFLKD
jgi:pimeloyl-ACP methyl ester carboxylesterase